ncbi:MAG: transposase, partial [Butyrivibrio sp.]|nr:transposase [Butyrivibrio sp.]
IRKVKKYVCENEDCKQHQFVEHFEDCIQPYQQRSKRLTYMILSIATLTSFHGAEKLWELSGIKISDSTIRSMILNLKFPDDSNVEKIGVDDVANRKGQTYFTVVYALDDHRLLAILDGRDGKELYKWLEKHPKVNLVCRDRASAYSSTIKKWAAAHDCKVTEIADRFHLIQNCIHNISKHCSAWLPYRIAIIEEDGGITITDNSIPNKVASAKVEKPTEEQLNSFAQKYDNSPIDKDGNPIELELPLPDSSGSRLEDTEMVPEEQPVAIDTRDPPPNQPSSSISKDEPPTIEQKKKDKLDRLMLDIYERVDPNLPLKPQYKALADEFDLKAEEVGRYYRIKKAEVNETKMADSAHQAEEEAASAQQKRNEEYELACRIRAELDRSRPLKPQYEAMAEKYGIDKQTVSRYCRMNPEGLEAIRNPPPEPEPKERKPKKKKIDDFAYIIYKMLADNIDIGAIFWFVKGLGCTLVDESLIKHILVIYRIVYPQGNVPDAKDYLELSYPPGVHVFSRCAIMKYFMTVNPNTSKDSTLAKYEKEILKQFPSILKMRNIFTEFHSAIMGDDPIAINRFIENNKNGPLEGFCKSLIQDIEAIKNAIIYEYSSGFVEGGNSLFKMIKSIHRGRMKLKTLIPMCLYASFCSKKDFDLNDIAPWLDKTA